MGKFDNIDIFFIAIIGAYFITLACIILSLIIIKIKQIILKRKERKKVPKLKPVMEPEMIIDLSKEKLEKVEKKEKIKEKKEKREKKPRFKLSNVAIIQKLFMKKVENQDTANIAKIKETKKNINTKVIKENKLKTTFISLLNNLKSRKQEKVKTVEEVRKELESELVVVEQKVEKPVIDRKISIEPSEKKAKPKETVVKEVVAKKESEPKKETVRKTTSTKSTTAKKPSSTSKTTKGTTTKKANTKNSTTNRKAKTTTTKTNTSKTTSKTTTPKKTTSKTTTTKKAPAKKSTTSQTKKPQTQTKKTSTKNETVKKTTSSTKKQANTKKGTIKK